MTVTPSSVPTAALPVETTLGNLAVRLEHLAQQGGWLGQTAYIDGAQSVTYEAIYVQVHQIAAALRGSGVRRGDRVLLALPDEISFVATFLGILRIGAVAVPVNTFFHPDELRLSEELAEAALVVTEPSLRGVFRGRTTTPTDLIAGNSSTDDSAAVVPDDAPAFAVFTSGTTGAPRLCFHMHGDAAYFDQAIGSVLSLEVGEICYSVSRMYFSFGLDNSLLLPLQRGATVVLTPQRPDESSALAVLRQHRVSVLFAQPSFYARILAHPDADTLARLRLAVVAGEMLPRPTEDRLRALLGSSLVNAWGTSEIGNAVLANRPDRITPYSLGQVLPPYRARVIDDRGEPLEDGSIGELQISGPTIGPGVARGSLPPARLTADEWFTTGDSAHVRDGVVWLHGRADDIEIVAGANVHPVEVEDLITAIAGVREAAVCAVRRANGVTTLRAYVVTELNDDRHHELTALILSTTRSSLTWYKVPEDVEYIDSLPRNGTGKILRRALRERPEAAPRGTA